MYGTGPNTSVIPAGSHGDDIAASGREFELLLEHGPLASATARHEARPVLTAWGLDDEQVSDALLVISELVTNAVVHARPPVTLHLRTPDDSPHVQIHVRDGGPQGAPSTWAALRTRDEHGRGIAIIGALTHHTGIGVDGDGLVDHWADLGDV
ncbi:ATP-binding protein [Streptomyces sp. NPDC057101]|uniref:ATP-binding protein n=1 Tax=Streptomyces sp. NPDC057101 TaxID=3346020 RepID=UPI0036410248